jgi:2-oxoisovalerate dehydrogenase E1 component
VNTAATLGLPVVFAVVNNQYAFSLHNPGVSRLAYTAHRADGYGIPGIVVDGNEVLEVYSAAREAVERARSGEGPGLVEAVTFRHGGHHVADPAAYVDPEAHRSWLARDPLPRFEEFLGTRGLLDEARRAHLHQRVRSRLTRTLDWALAQPGPDPGPPSPEAQSPRVEAVLPEAAGAAVTMAEALTRALDEEMGRDEAVVLLGPDAAGPGGLHGVTRGLRERYGPRRVIDFPAAGPGLVGAAVGAARHGLRPVVELPARHLAGALSLLSGHAAGMEPPVPLVLRVPYGPGPLSAWDAADISALARRPGFRVVVPVTAPAAKGLLAAAVRHPGPVVLLEPAGLYAAAAPLPPGQYLETLDRARLARLGTDVTVVAWGAAVASAVEAAEQAAAEGVSLEVLDLQVLAPLDREAMVASVSRTGRLVVAEEDLPYGGPGAEVAAHVAEAAFWHLDAPVRRVAPPSRFPFDEGSAGPRPADILAAALSLARN